MSQAASNRMADIRFVLLVLVATTLAFSPTHTFAQASLTPDLSSINFGNQQIYVESDPVTLTLNNIGDASATGITCAVVNRPPFSDPNDPLRFTVATCPASLTVGTFFTVNVTFTPDEVGLVGASLEVAYNDGLGSAQTTISLDGAGVELSSDDFVTTWQTGNPGTSNSTSITVPMVGGFYDVDWDNDGIFDEFALSDSVTHDFGVIGIYKIRIRGTYDSIRFNWEGDKDKILSLDQWGTNAWTTMNAAFKGAGNLQVPAIDTPDFSSVTDMSAMFAHAFSANPDTSSWDTSSVTEMTSMFESATSANPDTSGWNTSSVTDMSFMFFYASSANPDTSGWDTSAVTNMEGIFRKAISASPNTSNWDTTAVTNMRQAFSNAFSANPDVSGWDTSAVTDMYGLFQDHSSANPDVSGWDTSEVTDTRWMFENATSFDQDIGSWDVTALLNAFGMFEGATLSTANYESLLMGWDAQSLQIGVDFTGGNSTFCSAEAATAKANMITSDSWVITDGGQSCLPNNPIVAPDLTPETDTGVSDNDNFTTDNMPDFYVECLIISDTVTIYTDYPTADQSVGSHVCSSVGTEVASVSTALMAGVHSITYTYTNVDGESGHSPSLAVTVDLIFASDFE